MRLISHPAQEEDLESIADLYFKSFGKPWEISSIRESFAIPGTFAILENDGLCVFRIAADEAEIYYIGVKENSRRQGSATVIFNALKKFLAEKNINKIFLEVSEENVPAINFYRKSAFKIIGRRPDYYNENGRKISAINMGLYL
jgi:[ribosomal protein S18]-alanine N-acetyltransferase